MKIRFNGLYSWFLLIVIYILIFVQYPVGVTISRLVLHKEITEMMQPSLLLLWGFIRIAVILPLIFTLVTKESLDRDDIYLRFGDFNKVLRVTFWSTFVFTLLGFVLYPWFLNTTNLTVLRFFEYAPFFLTYAITNAFVEETFFRGVGLTMLSRRFVFISANVIQAIFFAIIHVTSPMATSLWYFVTLTFVLGLAWGYLTKKYNSLFPAIVLHVVADIFVAVSLF